MDELMFREMNSEAADLCGYRNRDGIIWYKSHAVDKNGRDLDPNESIMDVGEREVDAPARHYDQGAGFDWEHRLPYKKLHCRNVYHEERRGIDHNEYWLLDYSDEDHHWSWNGKTRWNGKLYDDDLMFDIPEHQEFYKKHLGVDRELTDEEKVDANMWFYLCYYRKVIKKQMCLSYFEKYIDFLHEKFGITKKFFEK